MVAGAQIATAVMQFIRLPILTRSLGPDDYGNWSLIWVTVALVTPFAMLGLQSSMTRFLAAEKDTAKIREGVFSSTVLVLGGSVLFIIVLSILAGPVFGSFIGNTIDAKLVRIASTMVIAESLLGMASCYLKTFRQMRWYAVGITVRQVLELVLMYLLLQAGQEITGLIVAILVSDLTMVIVVYTLIIRQNGFSMPRFTYLREWMRYGIFTVPSSAILWIIHSSDRYIVAWALGDREVGIYAASYTLANIVSMTLSPVQAVLFPTLSKSFDQHDLTATRDYLAFTLKFLAFVSFPIAFGLWALAPGLLPMLTTTEFSAGATAVAYVGFGLLFYSLFQISLYVLYLYKKTYLETILLASSAVLNIVLNLVLIPLMGINGAALATLIAFLVLGCVTTVIARRNLTYPMSALFIIKSIVSSLLMWVAISLWKPDGWGSIVLSIVVGAVLYFALMLAFRAFRRGEISFLLDLARRLGRTA
jgi:O-antigen/teichoic acid export membrane protein